MNRVKFLLFALVALGLIGWSLKLAPTLGADSGARSASVALAAVPAAVALKIENRRSELQSAVIRLGASPAVANLGPKGVKPEPPPPERLVAVRAAATEGASDALKAALVVLVSTEGGALMAVGPADASAPAEGVDVASITASGGAGAVVNISGVWHLFYALPLTASDKNEVKPAGVAAIGAPLLGDAKTVFGSLRADLGLSNLALLSDNKPVVFEGDKASIEAQAKSVKQGAVVTVAEGATEQLGPLSLPMMSGLTKELALRRPIGGTPYEVLATVSSTDRLVALAGFQKFGLGALVGLFLLSIAVTALLKSGEEEGASMVMPPPMPMPPPRVSSMPPQPPPGAPAPAPAPEASPDDFDFPSAPAQSTKPVTLQAPAYEPKSPSSTIDEPASDPFENLAPAPAPVSKPPVNTANLPAYQPAPPQQPAPTTSPSPAPARAVPNPFDDEEGARTMAYPIFKPPPPGASAPPPPMADPFAMAGGASATDAPSGDTDYNPDTTRVAAVPAELIKAARQASVTGERQPVQRAAVSTTSAAPKVSSVIGNAGALDEERHFQDVFREFVATREKCGEPADGLTYDKFKAKLVKNKDQLVQKHACKSVRFQVYVKDGKAALKATPIKE